MVVKTAHPACIIKEGTWEDFRKEVKAVNPEMFDIIEKISPGKKYHLIKATYLYGEKITDLGVICLPDQVNRLSRLTDPNVSRKFKDQLGYCPTPLILQLNNGAEVFIEGRERVIPLNVFSPGDLYGLFEVCVPITGCEMRPHWSVTSGARSVFFGAKISDAIGHKILRGVYGVPTSPPRRLIDQWDTLKVIGKRGSNEQPWASSVLIFTKEWFEKKPQDIDWLRFHHYLLVKSWWQSKNTRVRLEYDSLVWESFADFVCKRNLKPGPYVIDTIKHLLQIVNGTAPGFKIYNDNEVFLPASLFERAYREDYGLKYAPIFLGPCFFDNKVADSSAYYSLSYPTLLEGTPSIRYAPSIISELQEVRTLINCLEHVLKTEQLSHFYEPIKNICFRYFHDEEDRFGELLHSSAIVQCDPSLQNLLKGKFKDMEFPLHGQFFRGCVQFTNQFMPDSVEQ